MYGFIYFYCFHISINKRTSSPNQKKLSLCLGLKSYIYQSMKVFSLLLIICVPIFCNGQGKNEHKESQVIEGYFFVLENKKIFKSAAVEKTDTFRLRLDTIIYSTGNPKAELHLQFTDSLNGFIFGNEMGYGYWPFLFKTTNGGKNWERKLFKPSEGGVPILKDNFFMFDTQRGILIQNRNNVKQLLNGKTKVSLVYYLTKDGGETWTEKSFPLKTRNIRLENSEYFLKCAYTKNGEINIQVLRPPWASPKGKREAKDRITVTLNSKDYGLSFVEHTEE